MKLKGIELLGTYKVKYYSDWFSVYDSNGNKVYYENSNGLWIKREYDSNNNQVYFEDSDGYWSKREYDSNDNVVYSENSYGLINDDRVKNEMTLEEVCKELGRDIKIIKKEKL